jgi:hypothetical protein
MKGQKMRSKYTKASNWQMISPMSIHSTSVHADHDSNVFLRLAVVDLPSPSEIEAKNNLSGNRQKFQTPDEIELVSIRLDPQQAIYIMGLLNDFLNQIREENPHILARYGISIQKKGV